MKNELSRMRVPTFDWLSIGCVLAICACSSPDDKMGTIIANQDASAKQDAELQDAIVDASGLPPDASNGCVPELPTEPMPDGPPCSMQFIPCLNACEEGVGMACAESCFAAEIESCRACVRDFAAYCSSVHGACSSRYEQYYCCLDQADCNNDPDGCQEDLCNAHAESLRMCINTDQTCVSNAIVGCSPNP